MKPFLSIMRFCIIILLLSSCQDNRSLVGHVVTEPEKPDWSNYRFTNHQVKVAELEVLQAEVHELIEKPDDPESENAKKIHHALRGVRETDF